MRISPSYSNRRLAPYWPEALARVPYRRLRPAAGYNIAYIGAQATEIPAWARGKIDEATACNLLRAHRVDGVANRAGQCGRRGHRWGYKGAARLRDRRRRGGCHHQHERDADPGGYGNNL